MTPAPVIRLHPDDGVLIARSSLPAGTIVAWRDHARAHSRRPQGRDPRPSRSANRSVVTARSSALRPRRLRRASTFTPRIAAWAILPRTTPWASTSSRCRTRSARDLEGIRRPDGRVATRNYIGILTSGELQRHVAGMVADIFKKNPFTAKIRWPISPTSMAWSRSPTRPAAA